MAAGVTLAVPYVEQNAIKAQSLAQQTSNKRGIVDIPNCFSVLVVPLYYLLTIASYYWYTYSTSDGSSPKKSIPGRSRALNIDLEPSPSPGPSQKFDLEP